MDLKFNFRTPKEMAASSIQWFVMLVVLALALRFLFRLFGAEGTGDGFVHWLYGTTDVLLQPVRGVFTHGSTEKNAVEFQTLFAAVAYMVVGLVAGGVVERWSPKK
jgi:hypothetical protein